MWLKRRGRWEGTWLLLFDATRTGAEVQGDTEGVISGATELPSSNVTNHQNLPYLERSHLFDPALVMIKDHICIAFGDLV